MPSKSGRQERAAVWNMQLYTGKPDGGAAERNQGKRVVLEMSQGLSSHNITCNNCFMSYNLGQKLLKRKLTMVGTIWKNRTELPPEVLTVKKRPTLPWDLTFQTNE